MEWLLVLTMNITEAGQVTQAPTMLSGFSTKEKCKKAGEAIARTLMSQAAKIRAAKGNGAKAQAPYAWSDCIGLEK